MLGPRRTLDDIPNVLYHGTGIRELLCILHSDSLEALDAVDGGPTGTSLTARFEIARSFAEEVSDRALQGSYLEDYGPSLMPEGEPGGCVIELDGASILRAGNVIRPFTDEPEYYDHDDEAEERAIGGIKELHLHLRGIHVRTADIEWHRQLYANAGEAEMLALCDIALAHPLRSELPLDTIPKIGDTAPRV